MLEAGLEFREGVKSIVVEALTTLPPALRPAHFSHEEQVDNDADQIRDRRRFAAFLAESQSGFFLLAPHLSYSIRIATRRTLICDCFLEVEPTLAKQFLIHMATAQPIFGYACAMEEREHRNRVTTTQGINTIESWVGRDLQKYIPGLYWLTLLSSALMEKHGMPLSKVVEIALEHIQVADGQHLLRFYDRPDEWKAASHVKGLIASIPGVFNVEKVKTELATAETFLDLHAVVRMWK
jgi:hypothetical protein